jgi:drug/metabolite transporter (DMT)-like permease
MSFEPFTVIFLRFFSAASFQPLVINLRLCSKQQKFLPVGIIGALNPILLFVALQYTQASVSPLVYASVPALTATYLYFRRKEKISLMNTLGITLGFIGIFLIVVLPLFEKGTPLIALKGNLLIVAAAIAFMFYGIMSKEHQRKYSSSPVTLTFYLAVTTLIMSIPFALLKSGG